MVLIIAEIASAHEGKIEQMLQLIDAAKGCGVDAVKFQIYRADFLCVQNHPDYQVYKQLEYDENLWGQILSYARQLQLAILADVFDTWGLSVMEKYGADGYKITSTVFWDEELIKQIANTGKPLYLGVGGISPMEIATTLEILIKNGAREVTLMYGFQSYPTKLDDTNLSRVTTLRERFKLRVGYADHIKGDSQMAIILPLVAIGCGAEVIEKHLTLDRSAGGLDYCSALNPDEFLTMVKLIRAVDTVVGTTNLPSGAERTYLRKVHKKIVAKRRIRAGEFIIPEALSFKRSSEPGILPSERQKILYRRAINDIREGETITEEKIERAGIGVLVAVRLKSTRLPNKAMIEIKGKRVIEHLLEHVKAAEIPDVVILCTSTRLDDAILLDIAQKMGVKSFAGSEEDVMGRFLEAAHQERIGTIVRVTGDSPCIDENHIDKAIIHHLRKGADYTRVVGMPIGTDCEVISTRALEKAHSFAVDPNYSEYLSFYFWNNPDMFHMEEMECDENVKFPDYRLTIDEPEDIELMKQIYSRLYRGGRTVPLRAVIELLNHHPELVAINKHLRQRYEVDKRLIDKLREKTKMKVE